MRAVAGVHPILRAAADGELPAWSECGNTRREHGGRVAHLLDGWAATLGLDDDERTRWRAAGLLHDALKNADPDVLRAEVDPRWPARVLHGPACAARLQADGVDDEEFLMAVAFHSIGHPSFRQLGEHLYLADFLEPGRVQRAEERAELRRIMPAGREVALRAVIARRLERLIGQGRPILPETLAFWNRVTAE